MKARGSPGQSRCLSDPQRPLAAPHGDDGVDLACRIDRAKRRRVATAAKSYLAATRPGEWREARFDVVAVDAAGPSPAIRHYAGAFDARGNLI